MMGNGHENRSDRLVLRSRLSELRELPSWIERLASGHSIPAPIQFAMELCLEEAISNIIRYGYFGQPDHSISVHFTSPRDGHFVLVVEDASPPFNPVTSPELPPLSSLDDGPIGGQGIRLLREFADALEYQATPSGNRLSIGFHVADSATARG